MATRRRTRRPPRPTRAVAKPRATAARARAPSTAVAAHFARSAIIAAAAKVFTQRGVAATRVEDILQAASIARRTFYRYFASKDEVLAALHDVWTGELVKAIEEVRVQRPDEPLAGIRAGIDIFLGFYRSGPRVVRELVEIAIQSGSLLAPRRRWLRAQVVRLMDQAVQDHDGRTLDPTVYYGLLAAFEGLAIGLGDPATTPGDVDRVRAAIHAIIDNALRLPHPAPLPRRTRP